MRTFRINIPGVGNVYVRASSEQDALQAATRFGRSRGLSTTDLAGLTAVAAYFGTIPLRKLAGSSPLIDLRGNQVPYEQFEQMSRAFAAGALNDDGSITQPPDPGNQSRVDDLIDRIGLPGGASGFPVTGISDRLIEEGGDLIQTDQGLQDRRLLGETAQPFGAFQNFLSGRGIGASSPLQGAASAFFNPAEAAFLLGGVTGQVSGQGATPFQDFLKQAGVGGIPGQSLNVLRGLGGGGTQSDPAAVAQAFEQAGQPEIAKAILESPNFQEFLQSVGPGSELGRTFSQLGQGALAARTSPLFAARFGRQFIQSLQDQFGRNVAAGAIGPTGRAASSYLDLLRSSIL